MHWPKQRMLTVCKIKMNVYVFLNNCGLFGRVSQQTQLLYQPPLKDLSKISLFADLSI